MNCYKCKYFVIKSRDSTIREECQSGVCYLSPPVPLVVQSTVYETMNVLSGSKYDSVIPAKVIYERPSVSGMDFCSNYEIKENLLNEKPTTN